MEVCEVEPVEIEVREVEPVEVVEPAIVGPATLKSPEQVLYVKRKMPKRKRKFGRGDTRGGDQKSSHPNIVYQTLYYLFPIMMMITATLIMSMPNG